MTRGKGRDRFKWCPVFVHRDEEEAEEEEALSAVRCVLAGCRRMANSDRATRETNESNKEANRPRAR